MTYNGILSLFLGFGAINFFIKIFDYILNVALVYYFTPQEYGTFSLSATLILMLIPFLGLGLNGAVVRYFYKYEGLERNSFLSTTFLTSLFFTFLIVALFVSFSKPLLELAVPGLPFVPLALITIFISAFEYNNNLYISIFRINKDIRGFFYSNAAHAVIKFSCIGIALFWFDTVYHLLMAILLSSALFFGLVLIDFYRKIGFTYNRKYLGLIVSYGFLLLPVSLLLILNNYFDRIIIAKYLGNAELGIYTAAANIALGISFIAQIFNMSVMPYFIESYEKNSDDFSANMIDIYRFGFYGVYFVAILLSIFAVMIAPLLPSSYFMSVRFVPLLAFTNVMGMLYIISTNFMSLELNMMKYKIYVLLVFVLLNILFNILFLQWLGPAGPAISNIVSMGLIVLCYTIIVNRVDGIKLPYNLIVLTFLTTVGCYFLVDFLLTASLVLQAITFAIVLIIFTLVLGNGIRYLKKIEY